MGNGSTWATTRHWGGPPAWPHALPASSRSWLTSPTKPGRTRGSCAYSSSAAGGCAAQAAGGFRQPLSWHVSEQQTDGIWSACSCAMCSAAGWCCAAAWSPSSWTTSKTRTTPAPAATRCSTSRRNNAANDKTPANLAGRFPISVDHKSNFTLANRLGVIVQPQPQPQIPRSRRRAACDKPSNLHALFFFLICHVRKFEINAHFTFFKWRHAHKL